jgi:hypothetical protein
MRPFPSACIAALGYGGWAFIAQQFDAALGSSSVAVRAAVVQASFAFISTLMLGHFARYMYAQSHSRALAFISCSLLLCLVPSSLHVLNQSPQIFLAVLPGLIVGHCYLSGLVYFELGRSKVAR